MELLIEANSIKNNLQSLDLLKTNDIGLEINNLNMKSDFEKIIEGVIDKSADYIIKAMPVGQNIKDILIDIKKAFKTRDFKNVISTALNSSIREGLELLGTPISMAKDIIKLKDIAIKGGLKQAISAGIDIIAHKYIKGNLMGDIIMGFFNKMKDFVKNNAFATKLDLGIKKVMSKANDFKKICDEWYSAYNKFDFENINEIANKIKLKEKGLVLDIDSIKTSKTIQNITSLVNAKREKLSQTQLQMCETL